MNPKLSLEVWKKRLREDCEQRGEIQNFLCLGDHVLEILWRTGIEPTAQALADSGTRVLRLA
jgi:hypothetical protein